MKLWSKLKDTQAEKSLKEMMDSYKQDIYWDDDSGELIIPNKKREIRENKIDAILNDEDYEGDIKYELPNMKFQKEYWL